MTRALSAFDQSSRIQPPIWAEAHARKARVKAANAAGRSQNRWCCGIHDMSSNPPISVKATLRWVPVKAAYAAGRNQNRRLLRGFTV
jgi:hypothetical protein